MKQIATILPLFFICFQTYSQNKNDDYEFGLVTQEEIEMTVYEKDTNASAVVIYEHADSKFIGRGNRIEFQTKIKTLKGRK